MSIDAVTAVTGRPAPRCAPTRAARARPPRRRSAGGRRTRPRRVAVAREQVVLERLHQRADQRGVLAGDRGGDHRRDRRERDAEPQRRDGGPSSRRRCGRSCRRRSSRPARRCPTTRPRRRRARWRRAPGSPARRGRRSARSGCSRQAGSASTGSRSIRRTRKRNERERAPITIDARSAIPSGTAPSSARSTARREPRWRESGASRGDQAAEVDDAPQPGGSRRRRRTPRRTPARARRTRRRGLLHRVDQVVGDVDAVERGLQTRARGHVAEHELVDRHGDAARACARSRARRCPSARSRPASSEPT